MKRAVAYLRVSTEDQAEHGVSLEAQRRTVAAYCGMKGFELVETLVDAGVSGSIPLGDRPAGRRIADLIAAGATHVVGLKLDRFFRDASNALTQTKAWDRAGIALHLCDMGGGAVDTSSPMGRMMLTMLAGFAEFERALIIERTVTAIRHKQAKGERTGSIPYGTRLAADGRTLEPHARERETIARARELSAGGLSLRQVSAALAREGRVSRAYGPFNPNQVRRMLGAA